MQGSHSSPDSQLVPVGDTDDRDTTVAVEMMIRLTELTGILLDAGSVTQAVRRAEAEHPGPWADTWLQRLRQAGSELGLRIDGGRWLAADALAYVRVGSPVISFVPQPDGGGEWLLVHELRGPRVCTSGKAGKLKERPASQRRLHRRLGSVPVEWAMVQPIRPCDALGHEGQQPHVSHGPPPLRRLLGLLRAETRDLWVIVLFALGIGVLSLATPITVEAIVTTAIGGSVALLQQVVVLSCVLFLSLGLAAIMRCLQGIVIEYLQQRIFVRVVADLAYRLPRVRAESFDREHGPELVNRFFDVLTVQKASAVLLLDGVTVVLQGVIGMSVLAFYHPFLLGFDLVLLAAVSFIVFLLGRGAVRTSIQESLAKYAVAGWLEEMVRHPMAFKLSGGRTYALERADRLTRDYLLARKSHFRILYRQVIFSLALQVLANVALLGLGGWLVIYNRLTPGQLVAAELIVAVVVGSFVKLGKSLENYYDLLAAMDKLGHLVDLPLEREGGESHRGLPGPASLQLRGVTFDYETDARGPILSRFNLAVRAGERVAITGGAGSGKSTLAELIYGLREPQEGVLMLDGVDTRDIRLGELRTHIATVGEIEIFQGSVLENVRMGRSHVRLSEVREAIATVGLEEAIQELSEGLHTQLATGGSPLSQSQTRALMVARAVAGRPRLLVIDETLDGMDVASRCCVLDRLFDRSAPWTVIVITRDTEVIRRCDRTVGLDATPVLAAPCA